MTKVFYLRFSDAQFAVHSFDSRLCGDECFDSLKIATKIVGKVKQRGSYKAISSYLQSVNRLAWSVVYWWDIITWLSAALFCCGYCTSVILRKIQSITRLFNDLFFYAGVIKIHWSSQSIQSTFKWTTAQTNSRASFVCLFLLFSLCAIILSFRSQRQLNRYSRLCMCVYQRCISYTRNQVRKDNNKAINTSNQMRRIAHARAYSQLSSNSVSHKSQTTPHRFIVTVFSLVFVFCLV